MDWNRVEGNWKQFKGSAKEKWGKLTDDDLNVIEGRREQLEGKLQQRYGFAKDQIRRERRRLVQHVEVGSLAQSPGQAPGLLLCAFGNDGSEYRNVFQ